MERPDEFANVARKRPLVALRATPGERLLEKNALEVLEFKVRLKPPVELFVPPLGPNRRFTGDELEVMLQSFREPMIIFCSEAQLHKYKAVSCIFDDVKHYVDQEIISQVPH